jgi:hypothetical protein
VDPFSFWPLCCLSSISTTLVSSYSPGKSTNRNEPRFQRSMSSTWQNSVFLLRFYISPFNHLYLCEYQNRTQTIYTRSERYRHSDIMPTKSLQNKVHSFYLSTSCSLSIKNILCTPNTNFFYFYLIVIELCQRSPTHTVFDM